MNTIKGILHILGVAEAIITELEPTIEADIAAGKSTKEIVRDCLSVVLAKAIAS